MPSFSAAFSFPSTVPRSSATLLLEVVSPRDGPAESALDAGLSVATGVQAQVVLFEAAETLSKSLSTANYLEVKAEGAEAVGLRVSTVVGHGEPGLDILLQADIFEASVIALASRGRSGLPRALLGSVASQVIAHSQVPVLLTRRAASEAHAGELAGPVSQVQA